MEEGRSNYPHFTADLKPDQVHAQILSTISYDSGDDNDYDNGNGNDRDGVEDEFDVVDDGEEFRRRQRTSRVDTPLTLSVANYIKWECTLVFLAWVERITSEMAKHRGFLGTTLIEPPREGDPYVYSFSFDTLDNLLHYIGSPIRDQLLEELEPMLEATSVAQVAQERAIGNLFAELFVTSEGLVPVRPPPLWKTCILVTIPLFIVVWPVTVNVLPILVTSYKLNIYAALTICSVITVFANTYIGVPLMNMQFGEWLMAPVPHVPTISTKSWTIAACYARSKRTIYRWLDVGLPLSGQITVTAIFFGALIICGSLNVE
jgi:antibiotic biosynthesis monooxygenase (ABM) superfamily enzyme